MKSDGSTTRLCPTDDGNEAKEKMMRSGGRNITVLGSWEEQWNPTVDSGTEYCAILQLKSITGTPDFN